MTLEEKISDRIVVFQIRQDLCIAFELAELYISLAVRKNCKIKIAEACQQAIYWIKTSKIEFPEYIEQLSCIGQRDELAKLLAKAKVDLK